LQRTTSDHNTGDYNMDINLPNGNHNIIIRIIDNNNNNNQPITTNPIPITVNVPVATPPVAPRPVASTIPRIENLNTNTPTFTGTAQPNTTIDLIDDSGQRL